MDFEFRPMYDNNCNNGDPSISGGANYHQGPVFFIFNDNRSGFGPFHSSIKHTLYLHLKQVEIFR